MVKPLLVLVNLSRITKLDSTDDVLDIVLSILILLRSAFTRSIYSGLDFISIIISTA